MVYLKTKNATFIIFLQRILGGRLLQTITDT